MEKRKGSPFRRGRKAMFLAAVFAVFMAFRLVTVSAGDGLNNCGENLSTQVGGGTYTLSIDLIDPNGSGQMTNFYYEENGLDAFPWSGYRSEIEAVKLGNGVTDISSDAFRNMPNLHTVYLPKTLNYIGKQAFYKCNTLKDVYYSGDQYEWDEFAKTNINTGNDSLLNANLHCINKRWGIYQFENGEVKVSGTEIPQAFINTLDTAKGYDVSITQMTVAGHDRGYDFNKDGAADIAIDLEAGGTGVTVYNVTKSTDLYEYTIELSNAAKASLQKQYKPFYAALTFVFKDHPDPESISLPSNVELPAGYSQVLMVTTKPADAYLGSLKWKSSAPKICEVDASGKISAKSQGRAVITVTDEYSGKSGKCNVFVLFSDVTDKSKAAYEAVYSLADRGLVKGYGSYFDINAKCTRAQVVLFLWRAAGSPAPKSTTLKFSDAADIEKMAPDYKKAILWGNEKGYVLGFTSGANKGKFKPNDTCTRGQIVTFLWRYKGKKAAKSGAKTFPDVPKSHVYYSSVMWASSYGIAKGYSDGTFRPDQTCTRGECVTFLYRAIG